MRQYKKIILFLLTGVGLLSGCKDVFEENIDGKKVNIISPPDSLHTSQLTQTFWWEQIDEAENYRVQIVEGTFDYALRFVADSLVAGDKYELSLTPGTYQWRIRPENNGGHGDYQTRTLFIDSTYNLSNQQVVLTAPSNSFLTNQTNIQFSWEELYNADEYRFQLIDLATNTTLEDQVLTSNTISFLLAEGSYQWKVRAQNSISVSAYTTRTFSIDLTSPSAPFNLLPITNSLVSNGDTLFWSVEATSVADTLYLSTDTFFVSPAPTKIFSTDTFYKINLPTGSYFWKLRSVDAVGNAGSFSATQKFILF